MYTDAKGYKTMSYDRLTAVIVEAIKELKANMPTYLNLAIKEFLESIKVFEATRLNTFDIIGVKKATLVKNEKRKCANCGEEFEYFGVSDMCIKCIPATFSTVIR